MSEGDGGTNWEQIGRIIFIVTTIILLLVLAVVGLSSLRPG